MIDAWATFWTWVLIGTTIGFACLAVVVAIGGFFDIGALLKTMDRQHQDTLAREAADETGEEKKARNDPKVG